MISTASAPMQNFQWTKHEVVASRNHTYVLAKGPHAGDPGKEAMSKTPDNRIAKVYLSRSQDADLRLIAVERGMTVSELLRELGMAEVRRARRRAA